MAENYYETPKGILEILWRDGYHAAARLIERLQTTVSRTAEFEFLRAYVVESCFDDDICRDRLRMLWTAYCLHHDLDVDTAGYDNDLLELWNKLTETGDGTSEWADFDGFDKFMCIYLV